MDEQIAAFVERLHQDPALRQEVEAVLKGSRCAGDVADIARAHGYRFELSTFLEVLEEAKAASPAATDPGELDDAALGAVAGGVSGAGRGLLGSSTGWAGDALLRSIASSLTCCGECLEARLAESETDTGSAGRQPDPAA